MRMLEKIVEQDFQPNFWVNSTCVFFFAFFSSLLDWIAFILLHISAGKISFPCTSKMTNLSLKQGLSEGLQGMWTGMRQVFKGSSGAKGLISPINFWANKWPITYFWYSAIL